MADMEKTVILKVGTTEAVRSINDLKSNISVLKKTLSTLEIGTEEYQNVLKELTVNQNALKDAMYATTGSMDDVVGSAKGLTTSYNSLVRQLADLKKEWRATGDEARRMDLGRQIADINNQLKEMDASVGTFGRNVGNYVSHWDGMPEVAKDFGTAMREMNEQIEPTKMKFESVANIASGLASGFAAVQGAAALLGIENENLEKTFVKLQAAMALAQGIGGLSGLVEGFGKASVAFRNFGNTVKTVSATMGKVGWIAVIMAVISAITLATGAIIKKRQEVDTLNASLDKIGKKNDSIIASDKERARQLEREIKLMQAQGASEQEVINKRVKYNDLYYEAAEKNYKKAQRQYMGLKDSLSMGIKGIKQEDVDKAKELYDQAYATFTDYAEKRKDLLNDLVIAQIKAKKEIVKNELPELSNDIEVEDTDITVSNNINISETNTDAGKKADILNGLYERQAERRKETMRMSLEDEEEIAQQEYQINLELQEKKLENLKRFKEEAIANGDVTGQLELAEEIADQELQIERTKYDEIKRLEEKSAADSEKVAERKKETITMLAGATASILGSIADMYESDEKSAKKNAQKIKGLRIAEATINTINGAIGAYTSAAANIPAPAGIIVGAAQAAIVTAAGIANIMKIKNTDINGSSSGSGIGAAVSPQAPTYTNELPATYVRNLTSSSEIDEINKDTRVYILESDIQESNKRVQIRQEEATF